MKGLSPDAGHAQQVIGFGKRGVLFLHQQPGNGGGVAQVDGQLQVRAAEEGVLAGQAAYQAGTLRVQRQVMIPECLVSGFGNAIQAVPAAIMQGRTEGGLAGGNA
ncbi:hypothetical protein D3C76_1563590 [compost metagenome]